MSTFIAIGELLIDFISNEIDTPLEDVATFIKAPGGAPANVAIAMKRLGFKSAFIGKIGNDCFGKYLISVLKNNNINISDLRIDKKVRTTLVFVENRTDGKKYLQFYRNPGADEKLTPDEIDENLIKNGKLFHFGSIGFSKDPCRKAQEKALDIARENKLLISYDPNWRPDIWKDHIIARKIIQHYFKYANVVKIADEEIEFVTGFHNPEKASKWILSQGVDIVIVSMGREGSFLATNNFQFYSKSYKVNVVDTLGAGDAFLAGSLYKLFQIWGKTNNFESIKKEKAEEVVRFSNAMGALSCTKIGTIPSFPNLKEVNDFLSKY